MSIESLRMQGSLLLWLVRYIVRLAVIIWSLELSILRFSWRKFVFNNPKIIWRYKRLSLGYTFFVRWIICWHLGFVEDYWLSKILMSLIDNIVLKFNHLLSHSVHLFSSVFNITKAISHSLLKKLNDIIIKFRTFI